MTNYDDVNAAWSGQTIPYISREEAAAISRKLFKRYGKPQDAASGRTKPIRMKPRLVWACMSDDPATLSRGWRRLVHDVSHHVHQYRWPKAKPHHPQHAKLELEMIEYVISKGWLQPKPVVKPTLDDKRAKRLVGIRLRLARWKTKAKRAETAIKKLKAAEKRTAKALAGV